MNDFSIDFLVIGAQKAATTSFFKYLSAHPQIYMPAEKEVEFFQDDQKFIRGKEWYYNRYFTLAPPAAMKGEASTYYMMFRCVPERIHRYYPDIKLFALLRNPIDRAYSHYRMAVRRGFETRSFEESVRESLATGSKADRELDHNREYVFFGEYGRILKNYLRWFDRSQVMVLFSEQLLAEPATVIRQAYSFLGVDQNFVPQSIGKRYHASGIQRFPNLTLRLRRFVDRLKKRRWVDRYLWRINFDALLFWVETQFNVKNTMDPGPSIEIRKVLADHYKSDVAVLRNLLQMELPWPDFCEHPDSIELKYSDNTNR